MKQLRRYTIIGIVFVLVTGALSHFLYEWTGNNVIAGLFAPVSESVWEHMKLLFFPMLVYSIFMTFHLKKEYPCIMYALCAGGLAGTWLIPVFFYAYTKILGQNVLILDLGVFLVSTIIAFLIAYKLAGSCKIRFYRCWSYKLLMCILVCVNLICFLLFTYDPPHMELFAEPEETAFHEL